MQNFRLDNLDLALLDHLQNDTRQPMDRLGEAVGLSVSAVQRRLQRLRHAGVIEREVAIVDPVAIGRPLTMVVEVTLERERPHLLDEFKALMRETPEVMQCHYVTGNADFLLFVTARDMADYEAFTRRFFFENANIRRFHTSVVMDTVKRGFTLPLVPAPSDTAPDADRAPL